jgi:hypothetical protein
MILYTPENSHLLTQMAWDLIVENAPHWVAHTAHAPKVLMRVRFMRLTCPDNRVQVCVCSRDLPGKPRREPLAWDDALMLSCPARHLTLPLPAGITEHLVREGGRGGGKTERQRRYVTRRKP